jgi:hypothetical protein
MMNQKNRQQKTPIKVGVSFCERVTRFELVTFSLARRRSTAELHPQDGGIINAGSDLWQERILQSKPNHAPPSHQFITEIQQMRYHR